MAKKINLKAMTAPIQGALQAISNKLGPGSDFWEYWVLTATEDQADIIEACPDSIGKCLELKGILDELFHGMTVPIRAEIPTPTEPEEIEYTCDDNFGITKIIHPVR